MYKVFMNDKPIIITDSCEKLNNCEVHNFHEINFRELQNKINSIDVNGVYLISKNIKADWEKFKSNFKVIEAAGGLVKNRKDETLFIYRLGKWDLPKGHIEKNETKQVAAVREVEEECGFSGLIIRKELNSTYHVFKFKERFYLKVTYWFLMNTDYEGELTPQIEEDISEVIFKNNSDTKEALKNTYENIKLLF